MTEFYKNNKLPLGLVQRRTRHEVHNVRREPEYDDTGAPPDTFSEPYGGKSSQGGGIVSILGYLKEDLENEILVAKTAETKAQNEFEDQRSAATKVLLALQAKLTSLEEGEADTDAKIADTKVKKQGDKKMQDGKKDYREALKPKCDWMKDAFETRRDNRQQEMNGLMQAKASLSGGGQAEEQEVLAQRDVLLRRGTGPRRA